MASTTKPLNTTTNKSRISITHPDDTKHTRRFIISLGKTMHEYGTSSYRLERLLTETTHLLGLNGTFLITPTSMNFIFWEDDSEGETSYIARVAPGGIDLNRLSLTHARKRSRLVLALSG